MNSFEDREKSFEKKFAHSEIKISSNRSFGLVFFVDIPISIIRAI